MFARADFDSFVHLKNIMVFNSGDGDKIKEEFLALVRDEGESDSD